LRRGGWGPLLLGALGMGVGMLAKGPIGVVAPGFALFADVLVHQRWRRLLDARLLVAPLVIAAVLAPMLVGLHRQFGMRGLEFFFWTQSFGRVTGASSWANDTSPLYFTHTFLWTFAPWAPVTLAGLWQAGRGWRSADSVVRDDARRDALAIGGFVLSLAALSLSRYKLPHYAYVSFPFAALLAGRALARWGSSVPTAMRAAVLGTAGVLLVAVVALSVWAFPVWAFRLAGVLWWCGAVAALVAAAFVVRAPRTVQTLPVAVAALVAATLWLGNGHVAPRLFAYQSESIAGARVREARVPDGDFVALATHRPSLDFAAQRVVPELPDTAAVRAALRGRAADRPLWVWARDEQLPALAHVAGAVDTVAMLPWFGISRANARFLNPRTRDAMTDTWALVRLTPRPTSTSSDR
jgi:4-amino-4-deoxy-L-arabinose transferase-like glycosyltransferase